MRGGNEKSPLVGKLNMRELGISILKFLLTIPLNKVMRVRFGHFRLPIDLRVARGAK